jgi:hypothetical protein
MIVAMRLVREGKRENGKFKYGSVPKAERAGSRTVEGSSWPKRLAEAAAFPGSARTLIGGVRS